MSYGAKKKDPAQKEQERHQKMLEQLLRLPGNDNCADCGQKGIITQHQQEIFHFAHFSN